VLAVSALVDAVPLVVSEPLQPPEAVQLVAFVEIHVRVDGWPDMTYAGLAVIDTVGGGGTVTVAAAAAVPPEPEQVRV
jgi:hypothetical protein